MLEYGLLLGLAQDGGLPHSGCFCHNCTTFPPKNVVAMAVIKGTDVWLIDASPDIKQQMAMLHTRVPGFNLRGIFLTHLHMGHYLGLAQLGKEALNMHRLPVYASQRVCTWLERNGPWDIYVKDENITLHVLAPDEAVELSSSLSLVPFHVPHREDVSDTYAYMIQGNMRRLLFCPDTDGWATWQPPLATRLNQVDVALLDATFFSADELPGRDLRTIPHPLVTETVKYIQQLLAEHGEADRRDQPGSTQQCAQQRSNAEDGPKHTWSARRDAAMAQSIIPGDIGSSTSQAQAPVNAGQVGEVTGGGTGGAGGEGSTSEEGGRQVGIEVGGDGDWVKVPRLSVRGIRCKEFVLVHLNHSNPLYDPKGWQRRWVEDRGVRVGEQGEVWQLSS